MLRSYVFPVFLFLLGLCACIPDPASQANPPLSQARSQDLPGTGLISYTDDFVGFSFMYPSTATLQEGSTEGTRGITYLNDTSTNVIEAYISVTSQTNSAPCVSPVAKGWAPTDLETERVELGGTPFIKQSHSGVAAGTSITWVVYTTERDERCVGLAFALSTFDPGNLDPTRFPDPPTSIDIHQAFLNFEDIVSTFRWLR
jgi:hypothetical protein